MGADVNNILTGCITILLSIGALIYISEANRRSKIYYEGDEKIKVSSFVLYLDILLILIGGILLLNNTLKFVKINSLGNIFVYLIFTAIIVSFFDYFFKKYRLNTACGKNEEKTGTKSVAAIKPRFENSEENRTPPAPQSPFTWNEEKKEKISDKPELKP